MRECGEVVRVKNTTAWIRITKSAHCAGCTACNMFENGQPREILAKNEISAKVGDMVEVEIKPGRVVGYSLLVFIFPIIFMFIGYALGVNLSAQIGLEYEQSGIIGAIIFLILSFVFIFIYDKLFGSKENSAYLVSLK